MKLSKLLTFNRAAVTNFASAMAGQAKTIPGFKMKANMLIEAMAREEGVSPETFLNSLDKAHLDALESYSKTAKFHFSARETKLVSVSVSLQPKGYADTSKITIYANPSDDGYVGVVQPRISASFPLPGGKVSAGDALENQQIAVNHAFELCKWINANRKTITSDNLPDDWDVVLYGDDLNLDPVAIKNAKKILYDAISVLRVLRNDNEGEYVVMEHRSSENHGVAFKKTWQIGLKTNNGNDKQLSEAFVVHVTNEFLGIESTSTGTVFHGTIDEFEKMFNVGCVLM